MKPQKGLVGCVTCGTSLGCFFPLALTFSLILVFAISNYFNPSYTWEEADTWMVIGLAMLAVPAVFIGLIQAVVGAWSLAGFFDGDVTQDELDQLAPIPSMDGEEQENNA